MKEAGFAHNLQLEPNRTSNITMKKHILIPIVLGGLMIFSLSVHAQPKTSDIRKAMIKKFDKDGDGKLDEKERPSQEELKAFFADQLGTRRETSAIIKQQDKPPLQIVRFICRHEEEYRSSVSVKYSNPEQIKHQVTYRNDSGKIIVALQIGISAFDAFNGHMGRFSGWSLETIKNGETETGVWTQRPYATFSFKKYGTGVCWVNAVRFEDGTIWRADMSKVLIELQKYQKDLKAEDLKEKKE